MHSKNKKSDGGNDMTDIIVSVIIAVLVVSAVVYIRKQKKKGAHCIGCPASGGCSCGCSDSKKSKKHI